MHISYTVQALYFLPIRAYRYKKKAWHYFLFDLCYYTTILNFVYIWLLPANTTLWIACYCLSHGSLASAVITWRNSLVFHDQDKIVSLFIHIYAPLTFTVTSNETLNEPELSDQPYASIVPRYRRVAPAGTTKSCVEPVPVPVRPSPMKKGCCNTGDKEVKPSPETGKSRPDGAADKLGCVSLRNTPTSEFKGAVRLVIPL